MPELPERYREVFRDATDLSPRDQQRMIALMELIYPWFASTPAPVDDSGSVWF